MNQLITTNKVQSVSHTWLFHLDQTMILNVNENDMVSWHPRHQRRGYSALALGQVSQGLLGISQRHNAPSQSILIKGKMEEMERTIKVGQEADVPKIIG
jgi:hypothetical protein